METFELNVVQYWSQIETFLVENDCDQQCGTYDLKMYYEHNEDSNLILIDSTSEVF